MAFQTYSLDNIDENHPLLRRASTYRRASEASLTRKQQLCQHLESRHFQLLVLILTLTDLIIVVAEMTLSLIDPFEERVSHVVLSIFTALSLTILSFFTLELFTHAFAFGLSYFCHVGHFLDLIVIVAALILEILLKGTSREIVGLLIVVRFWRVLRLMDAVALTVAIQTTGDKQHGEDRMREMEEELSETKTRCSDLELQLREELRKREELEDELNKLTQQSMEV